MVEEQHEVELHKPTVLQQHRFMVLIAGTIVISLFLVGVALALYASSGTAQLDLSRPGYTSVRDKVTRSDSFEGFSASGEVTEETLKEFQELYDKQSQQATNVDSFGGNVMSDKALSIDAPAN